MHLGRRIVYTASVALLLFPGRAAYAAAADDREKVLRQLDIAARNFHSTAADFEFVTVTTEPIYEKDVQKGIAFYRRDGAAFQMAAHIREIDGKPAPRDLTYSAGKVMLFDPLQNQLRVMDAAKYESYLLLGFGASGKELADKWQIKYLGQELLDGVKTDKMELTAKDPNVLKIFPKVTVWIDAEHAVSLKQVFDEGQGITRTCVYSRIKTNQPLPKDAFALKTNKQTQITR